MMSEQVVITRACGHRETSDLAVSGRDRSKAISVLEGALCSSCWRSEPQVRARLRRVLSEDRSDNGCPLGFMLEMFAKWWMSMGSGWVSTHGSGTESQHQLCSLANRLGEKQQALRDGLSDLFLKLTGAVSAGEVPAPPLPAPPYVLEPDTRPDDEVLAEGLLSVVRLYSGVRQYEPATVAAARKRLETVEDPVTREAAIALLNVTGGGARVRAW